MVYRTFSRRRWKWWLTSIRRPALSLQSPFYRYQSLPTSEKDAQQAAEAEQLSKTCIGLIITSFLTMLLTAAVIFLVFLYIDKSDKLKKDGVPKWPSPSISPLGKYTRAAVAADNELCSEIGRDTMLQGGNAVDAAIATIFCIGVMDAHSAGLGGGHMMTIYNVTTRKCSVVDAREVAPGTAHESMYVNRWSESQIGWRAVAVPGEIHGLYSAYIRFGGGTTWNKLVMPTVRLMEKGLPTSAALASALRKKKEWILKEPTMKSFINPQTGRIYEAGEQMRSRKALTETLRKLANSDDPIKDFYDGNLTHRIVKEFQANGGILTLEDFKNYRSNVMTDDQITHTILSHGRHICGPPPPSGSAVTQAILNILDGFDLKLDTVENTVNTYHKFIEASKFAYAVRNYLADPAFVKNSTETAKMITSPEWAKKIRSRITDKTHADSYYGLPSTAPPKDHGTAHVSVLDRDGNVVSVTSTINLYFGAMVTSESTGILWNDEMDDFSSPGQSNFFGFPPSSVNFIQPGKRPMSSMSPLIIFNEDPKNHQKIAVGGAGGSTIISGVSGVAMRLLFLNNEVKEAIDAPRIHNQLEPNATKYENRFPKEVIDGLKQRGHTMVPILNITVVTAVHKCSDGVVYANSDFRKGDESSPAGF